MTFSRALTRIADVIGWDGCAQVLECSENWARKLSDPDAGREISIQRAGRLDAAYRRAGGDGAPFTECLALQLELECAAMGSDSSAVIAAASVAAKESGEAVSAALAVVESGGSRESIDNALREIEEGIEAMTSMAARLRGRENLGDIGEPGRPH